MAIETRNPATGEVEKTFDSMTDDQVDEIIDTAHKTWMIWKKTSFSHRSELMMKAANVLRENNERYAKLMVTEMGKTISSARKEVEKCAWVCEYYAEHAESFLADEHIETEKSKSYVAFRPIGVVLAVMPWNFPFWQVFRFAAPALMAGNVGLLKHASNVPQCALAIEEVFREAGFPTGSFATLLIGSRSVDRVIENDAVKAVTLTGSVPAGKAVASKAGSVSKKTVLELGGSDPYIILDDADLDLAVDACVTSRLINAGQSCVAAKRFIVVEPLADAFEKKVVARMEAAVLGDPLDEKTEIGPQARHDLRDELHDQVTRSIASGARLLCGGEVPDMKGAYYPPTVLTNVMKGMPAYSEEFFGPVASIIRVKDVQEAVFVANDTVFGLGAAVFTQDIELGEKVAKECVEAGACFVNHFVYSDPRLPFGGIKESGYGRELSSFGIREFVNMKTVVIR